MDKDDIIYRSPQAPGRVVTCLKFITCDVVSFRGDGHLPAICKTARLL